LYSQQAPAAEIRNFDPSLVKSFKEVSAWELSNSTKSTEYNQEAPSETNGVWCLSRQSAGTPSSDAEKQAIQDIVACELSKAMVTEAEMTHGLRAEAPGIETEAGILQGDFLAGGKAHGRKLPSRRSEAPTESLRSGFHSQTPAQREDLVRRAMAAEVVQDIHDNTVAQLCREAVHTGEAPRADSCMSMAESVASWGACVRGSTPSRKLLATIEEGATDDVRPNTGGDSNKTGETEQALAGTKGSIATGSTTLASTGESWSRALAETPQHEKGSVMSTPHGTTPQSRTAEQVLHVEGGRDTPSLCSEISKELSQGLFERSVALSMGSPEKSTSIPSEQGQSTRQQDTT